MEALQMLKFAFKKSHLDSMSGWITSEQLMWELFGDDGEDAMDRIIQQLAEDDSDGGE